MESSGIPSIQTGTKSPVEPAQETIAEPSRHSFHASLVTEPQPENLNVIQNVNIEHNVEVLPELPLVTGEFKSVVEHMQWLVLSSEKRILQAVDRPGILQTIESVKTDLNKLLEEKDLKINYLETSNDNLSTRVQQLEVLMNTREARDRNKAIRISFMATHSCHNSLETMNVIWESVVSHAYIEAVKRGDIDSLPGKFETIEKCHPLHGNALYPDHKPIICSFTSRNYKELFMRYRAYCIDQYFFETGINIRITDDNTRINLDCLDKLEADEEVSSSWLKDGVVKFRRCNDPTTILTVLNPLGGSDNLLKLPIPMERRQRKVILRSPDESTYSQVTAAAPPQLDARRGRDTHRRGHIVPGRNRGTPRGAHTGQDRSHEDPQLSAGGGVRRDSVQGLLRNRGTQRGSQAGFGRGHEGPQPTAGGGARRGSAQGFHRGGGQGETG